MKVSLLRNDFLLLRRQSEMTGVIAREVLRIDELDGDENDQGTGDVVRGVGDLMRCAEMTVIEVQNKLKLIVVKGAELTELLLDLSHNIHVLRRLRVDCNVTVVDCGL